MKEDLKVLECIPRGATKPVRGLEVMSCEEQLWALGLSGLEKRRVRGDLVLSNSFLRRGSREGSAEFFPMGSRHLWKKGD